MWRSRHWIRAGKEWKQEVLGRLCAFVQGEHGLGKVVMREGVRGADGGEAGSSEGSRT